MTQIRKEPNRTGWQIAIAHLLGVVMLAFMPVCLAQVSTSVLGGKVMDPQNEVVPNAVVTVTSDETGVERTAKTNSTGNWRVDALVAGHYHFTVSAPGFETLQYPSFDLTMADQKFVDVALKVGSSNVTVTVHTAPPLIDTTAAVSGTVLENKDFQELPTLTNSANEYAKFTPGVVYAYTESTNGVYLWSNISLSSFTTNGSGSGSNAMNYTIDGATNSIVASGQMAFVPNLDSVDEVRVTTNAYDASIDRTAAGTLNMTLKSGGKAFHGDLYEINKNNYLNANYYQFKQQGKSLPPIHHNEYGGTIGGPVWIPKLWNGRKRGTFFFFSYDGIRDISPYAEGTLSLPTQAERNGDFSQSYTTQTVGGVTTTYPIRIFDPSTAAANGGVRTEFAGENISGRISPFAKAINALIPLPNKPSDGASTDSNDYIVDNQQFDKFYAYSIRLDQAWNNNHHSYVEYRYNNFWQLANDPFGLTNILGGGYLLRFNNGLTLNHAWVISPKLFLNLTGNATIYRTPSYAPSAGVDPTKYSFSSQLAAQQVFKGIPALNGVFGNVGGAGYGYQNDYIWELKGYLQQTWKNHTFHYGFDYQAQQEATGDHNNGAGNYTFNGIWTNQNPNASNPVGYGSPYADFLLGMPASGFENNDSTAYFSQPYFGVYFQDDWRATPKLTLNLGLRWDYQFAMTERHDKYWTRFDPTYNLAPVSSYIQSKYSADLSASGLGGQLLTSQKPNASSLVALGAIQYAGVNGTSRSITDPQPRYYQPRIGFAYQIHPNTVLRGGVGRFTQANYVANHANQTGYSSSTPFTATNDNYVTQASTLANPYPNGLVALTGNSAGVFTQVGTVTSFYTPDIKRQYTDDASLHLQQQFNNYLIEIGGVYEHTVGLTVGYQVDNPSIAQWHAAYDPQFDSTGRPVPLLPGDVQVPNPFKGAPYITTNLETASTITAYQLLRPNPLVNGLTENFYNGKSDHYALQAKVERRFQNGLSLNYAFSWGKQMDTTGYRTNSVVSQQLLRELSGGDVRFQHVVSSTYVLPFGRGKLIARDSGRVVDSIIGGWEASGVYTFYSGTPISLPTNSSFFEGGDPGTGNKSLTHWFDTSKFVPFPSQSTPVSQLRNPALYPDWTGVSALPGYGWTPTNPNDTEKNGVYHDFSTWSVNIPNNFGDVRNPFQNVRDIGLRKSFLVWREDKFQLRVDAFNALNHPRFGNISTNPSSAFFGYVNGSNTLSQINAPRSIQLEGKLYF